MGTAVQPKGERLMAELKKRRGDRFDATLVRDIDPLHWFMPYLYPNRADNEAFVREKFDLTNLETFLTKKNEGLDHAHRYTIFHAVCAAVVKAVTLRPQMNRFIQGRRLYQRDERADVSKWQLWTRKLRHSQKTYLPWKVQSYASMFPLSLMLDSPRCIVTRSSRAS